MVTFADIQQARARIAGLVRNTPLMPSANLSATTGVDLWLKLETLQVTGAFKERGAANYLLALPDEARARGVVAASAGNHAQGLALHASRLGIPATIVMPRFTPRIKVARTKRYGANVVLFGEDYDAAAVHAQALCGELGATFVHPFDDERVIAGQGSIGLEILEALPDVDAVVVPVGGGGLITGVATALKAQRPEIEVLGVQSASFASMARAIEAGAPVSVAGGRTIAEGIAVRRASPSMLAHVQRTVDEVIAVSEEEIARAIVMLIEDERLVAEGAGAAPLALVLSGRMPRLRGKKVALVISGGNVDINVVSSVIERGLVRVGRRVRFHMTVPDRPGVLAEFSRIVAEQGVNVLEIRHERAFSKTAIGDAEVELFLETAGFDDIEALRVRLEEAGYVLRP